jgi:hypothetical protein
MARNELRRFSDLSFIQSVDKPRFIAPLLKPYGDYFASLGLDVTALRNDDKTDRRLHEILTRSDEDTPRTLLQKLYELDDLADEAGHDRLIEEAGKRNLSLDGIVGENLSPGEFAIAVHAVHPYLLRCCHDRLVTRKVKNFVEYQSRSHERLRLESAQSKIRRLERLMAPWFAAHDREEICEIALFEEQGEFKFSVAHGPPFHVEPTYDKNKLRSRTGLRPQKQDSVVYDTRTGILRVNGQSHHEKELYRRTFGDVLFGDPEHFPAGDLYTLAPLKTVTSLATSVGIDSARLTEVWMDFEDEHHLVQISRAYDLLVACRKTGTPDFGHGKPIRAAFLLRYKSGGRPRRVEIRPSNIAIFDRDRDGDSTEAFLRANKFRKLDA